jgi:hypothetical protein
MHGRTRSRARTRPARGGAPSLAPPLTGSALWIRPDEGYYTPNGSAAGRVVNAADRSGNSRVYAQATEIRQPWLDSAGGPGGRNCVQFTTAGEWLSIAAFLGSATEAEVYAVVKADEDPASLASRGGLWSFGSLDGQRQFYPFTDGQIFETFGTNPRKTVGNPAALLTSWRRYHIVSRSGEFTARIDGTQVFTTSSNVAGFLGTGSYHLGSATGSTTHIFTGRLAELIVYTTYDASRRTVVDAYQRAHFSLS